MIGPDRTGRSAQDDRGAVTLFAVVMFAVLLLAAGLVADGGTKLAAARQAAAIAEEAARAGVEHVDIAQAYEHGGPLVINPLAAVAAARAWLAASGQTGAATVTGPDSIAVSVTVTKQTAILSIIGIGTVSERGTATASLSQGVESGSPP